jgi:hypothetical protein
MPPLMTSLRAPHSSGDSGQVQNKPEWVALSLKTHRRVSVRE